MITFKWVLISPYAEHVRKLVTWWLSMRKNRLLVNWGCMKIGYSLAEHVQKFVTRWLSMRENHFGAPSAFQRFSSLPLCQQFLCLLLPSLLDVLCPLSHIFVLSLMSFGLCLPSYVPCLMNLFLGYLPLSPVLRLCSLYTVLYPLSHGSAPGLPSSVPCLKGTWQWGGFSGVFAEIGSS